MGHSTCGWKPHKKSIVKQLDQPSTLVSMTCETDQHKCKHTGLPQSFYRVVLLTVTHNLFHYCSKDRVLDWTLQQLTKCLDNFLWETLTLGLSRKKKRKKMLMRQHLMSQGLSVRHSVSKQMTKLVWPLGSLVAHSSTMYMVKHYWQRDHFLKLHISIKCN